MKLKLLLSLILVFFLIGCGTPNDDQNAVSNDTVIHNQTSPQNFLIEMRQTRLFPYYLEVPKGSTITWINKEDKVHRLMEEKGAFDSGDLKSSRVYVFKFDNTGVYQYHCKYFPEMRGIILVK